MTTRARNPKPPTVGPFGETYTDHAGRVRERLTGEGRRLCGEWMARHPHPVALVMRAWPRLYRAARAVGLSDDDVDGAAAEGVLRSFIRFDPSRGVAASTVVTWGVRGAVGDLVRRRLRFVRELSVSQFDTGEARYLRTPAPTPDPDPHPHPDERVREVLADPSLTDRERKVLRLCLASSQRKAAAALGVSHQYVNQIRAAAVRKLQGLPTPDRETRGPRPTDGQRARAVLVMLAAAPGGVLSLNRLAVLARANARTLARVMPGLVAAGLVREEAAKNPKRARRSMPVYRLTGLGHLTEGRATA